MTHLTLPVTNHPRPPAAPAQPRAATSINPALFHDDIVRPELRNDAILASTRLPLSGQTTHIRHRIR